MEDSFSVGMEVLQLEAREDRFSVATVEPQLVEKEVWLLEAMVVLLLATMGILSAAMVVLLLAITDIVLEAKVAMLLVGDDISLRTLNDFYVSILINLYNVKNSNRG